MLTVYLLRDNLPAKPGYSVFATDEDEKILVPTVYGTKSYVDAILQANSLFDVLKLFKYSVACYLENDYETPYNVVYTIDQFSFRKLSNREFYTDLIDLYESRLGSVTPKQAFEQLVIDRMLNTQQQNTLKRLIDVQKNLFNSLSS